MVTTRKECAISDDDLRAALKEMGTYVDVTEEDLKKIYSIALKHAEERLASRIAVGDVMTKKSLPQERMQISMNYLLFYLKTGSVACLSWTKKIT